jgi:hypothetical protein
MKNDSDQGPWTNYLNHQVLGFGNEVEEGLEVIGVFAFIQFIEVGAFAGIFLVFFFLFD